MKVLFLDVDGVCNRNGKTEDKSMLEAPQCRLLEYVAASTGCRVVVSSTWRWMPTLYQRLQEMLAARRIPHEGRTECISLPTGCLRPDGGVIEKAVPRHEEIREWLSRHPQVTQYAIVDDDSDADDGTGRYVKTGTYEGLTPEKAEELIEILNR